MCTVQFYERIALAIIDVSVQRSDAFRGFPLSVVFETVEYTVIASLEILENNRKSRGVRVGKRSEKWQNINERPWKSVCEIRGSQGVKPP